MSSFVRTAYRFTFQRPLTAGKKNVSRGREERPDVRQHKHNANEAKKINPGSVPIFPPAAGRLVLTSAPPQNTCLRRVWRSAKKKTKIIDAAEVMRRN